MPAIASRPVSSVASAKKTSTSKDFENAALLAAISKSQAVIEFNMDGTIVTANENFLSALGYTLEEIKGRHHSMFVDAAYANSSEYREFWTRLNRGESMPGEYRRVSKSGKLIVIQASYNPIADKSGKLVKVVKFATDVTNTAVMNEDYKAKLDAIGKAQAVIEFDMEGKILRANDNFTNALGYSMEEIKGRHHSMFVEETYRSCAEYREFWARLNRGENLPGEYMRIAKGGRVIWIQASYNPIPDMNGKLVKVVKYASEITAAVKARTEMQRILKEVNSTRQYGGLLSRRADRGQHPNGRQRRGNVGAGQCRLGRFGASQQERPDGCNRR